MYESELTDRSARRSAYIFDDREDQYRRLVGMAQQYAQDTEDACRRARIEQGAKVIDVGCGPLGGLLTLAETVGPTGIVVGLDASPDALDIARTIIEENDLTTVTFVCADINRIRNADVCPPGPFDAAYCRLLLCHQVDPIITLERMASIVRRGGRIIAQEPLYDPRYPAFDPPIDQAEWVERMLGEAIRRSGAALDVARYFSDACQKAGLKEISQRGYFQAGPSNAPVFLEHQSHGTLLAIERSLVSHGIASEEEIQESLKSLENARRRTFRSFFGLPFVELIAQIP
jgi:ubiquinone/menaquinone biosynthesis C-methylase UbiE